MRLAPLALVALTLGCYSIVDIDGETDGGVASSVDGPWPDSPLGIDGGLRDARPRVDPDGAADLPVICGGATCAEGEVCCRLDARCVSPGDPSCAVPSGSPAGSCASSADCDEGEVCTYNESTSSWVRCAGTVGTCERRPDPSECPPGDGNIVCGCDGRTYPSPCVALNAGVVPAALGECGTAQIDFSHESCELDAHCNDPGDPGGFCDTTRMECVWTNTVRVCGSDASYCWPGEACCALTGHCHDPEVEGTCAVPPEGTLYPCASDLDCERTVGGFCDAASCAGPGGCRNVPSSCSGVVEPVCGCDGRTYQNECEAWRATVRVAHTGGC